MAIRSFKDIKINLPREFGEIYSFDLFTSDANVSTLNISLIKEDGNYPSFESLSSGFLTPYEIEIFNNLTIYMYLIGYSESTSSNQKTLTLNFIDGSHILDRVEVILMDQHVQSKDDLGNDKPNIAWFPKTFQRKVVCDSCYPNNFTKEIKTKQETRIIRSAIGIKDSSGSSYLTLADPAQGENVFGDSINGGFILVGTEDYSKTECDLRDVVFNFEDLKIAADRIGIKINIPSVFPNFTLDRGGSLKDMLSTFCAKFGIIPVYDLRKQQPNIDYIDLTTNSTYLKIKELKEAIKDLKSTEKEEPVVIGLNDSESKQGTYKQFTSINAKVASEFKKSTVRSLNYLTSYQAIKLRNLFGSQDFGGRTEEQIMISSYLGEASPIYRDLYNLSLRDKGLPDEDALPTCGFQPIYKIPNNETAKLDFVDSTIGLFSSLLGDIVKKYGAIDLNNVNNLTVDTSAFDIFFGTYDAHKKEKILEWERKIFNFLGKYFWNTTATAEEKNYCDNPFYSVQVKSEIDPPGSVVFKNFALSDEKDQYLALASLNSKTQMSPLPFGHILFSPFSENAELPLEFFYQNFKFIRIFERNSAAYSLDPKFLGKFLSNRYLSVQDLNEPNETHGNLTLDTQNPSPFDSFQPHFIPLDYPSVLSFYNLIRDEPSLQGSLLLLELEKRILPSNFVVLPTLHLGIAPSCATISHILEVSSLFEDVNRKEMLAAQENIANNSLECPPNPCQAELDPNIDPFGLNNPCACLVSSAVNPFETFSPSFKKYPTGVVNLGSCPAFFVKIKPINGALANRMFKVVFPFGTKIFKNNLLSQVDIWGRSRLTTASIQSSSIFRFASGAGAATGDMFVNDFIAINAIPAQTLGTPFFIHLIDNFLFTLHLSLRDAILGIDPIEHNYLPPLGFVTFAQVFDNSSEYYQANYHESISKSEFHNGFSKCLNDFGLVGDVSRISMTQQSVGHKVLKTPLTSSSSAELIPLDLQSYSANKLISLEEYFTIFKELSSANSLFPKKDLEVNCAGSTLGSLKKYLNSEYGFKSMTTNFDREGITFSLKFESRSTNFPEVFLHLFEKEMSALSTFRTQQ